MPGTDTSWFETNCQAAIKGCGHHVRQVNSFRGDVELVVEAHGIRDVVRHLKAEKPSFDVLMDLFGVDYLSFTGVPEQRFAVVYVLYSMALHRHLRLKAFVPESTPEVDSIHDLFKAANWFEREVWDMFGIRFKGHPNLARILCHADFDGHPLRKDYPPDKYQRLRGVARPTEF